MSIYILTEDEKSHKNYIFVLHISYIIKELRTVNVGDAVAVRIETLCKQRKITINKLSRMAGITQSTLNHVVCGHRKNPTVFTIQKVCEGLDISIYEFFDDELFYSKVFEEADEPSAS